MLAVLAMVGLATLYKVAPDRDQPRKRWVTWGAVIATVLWLLGSAVFTLYVENFGSFGETYGTFAGIIVLMLWLMLTRVHRPARCGDQRRDRTADGAGLTVGAPEPIGHRGADAADTTPADWEDGDRR